MILSPLDKRRSIGLTEAARVLGIPPRTLRRHAVEGAIPGAFRIGKRRSHWRFRTDILEYWGFVIGTGGGWLRCSGRTRIYSATTRDATWISGVICSVRMIWCA